MELKKIHIIAGIAIIAALSVLVLIQQSRLQSLQAQHDQSAAPGPGLKSSRLNHTLKLPAPKLHGGAEPSEKDAKDAKAADLYAQFHVPKLTIAQAEKYLAENRRSAASLVAAFRTSGHKKFLEEAMQKFPNDSHVAFEALFHADLTPDERRRWVDALKEVSPENALGNWLSAQAYFKAGLSDLAVGELEAAFGKAGFDDLTLQRMQSNEEAYRANGFTEAESRTVAMFQLPLPLLKEMKSLTENMVELSNSYRQSGDTASADATVSMALKLGESFRNGGNALLVHYQLGTGIEHSALQTLDPGAVFGPDGRTSQEMLDDLNADQAAINALVRETCPSRTA